VGRNNRSRGTGGRGRGNRSRDEEFLRDKGVVKGKGGAAAATGREGPAREGQGSRGGFRGRFGPARFRDGGSNVDYDSVLLTRFGENALVAMARRTDDRLRTMLAGGKLLPGDVPHSAKGATEASAETSPTTLASTSAMLPPQSGKGARGPQGGPGSPGAPGTPGSQPASGALQPSRSYLGQKFLRRPPVAEPAAGGATAAEPKVLPAEPKLSSLIGPSKRETTVTEGGLRLDPWQAEALEALLSGANIVVDAPTSAGKTRVIEALLEHKFKEGIKLVYTSPVKSLSNDKYREFSEKYGKEKVGINTGDFKENLGAPIILATLETYRNSLLGVEPNMNRRVVVYDEYHYLQDESRGSAWEESIILTPKESQLVLLSASVPNAEDFATWIEGLYGKPCKVIRITERPVPLVDLVHTRWGWILGDELKLGEEDVAKLRRMLRGAKTRRFLKQKEEIDAMLAPMGAALERNLGPVVVYAGRRASVEASAQAFAKALRGEWRGEDAAKLHARLADLPGWDYVPAELQRLIKKHGIAYHHSGMIPPGRVAIETLLKEGCLRVCTGTMGISLGVNFAVRSAVVSDETRPSEGGESRYSNSEILQMLGRAGRRGHDKQGFSLWVNAGRYAEQRPRAREACTSSLKFDPTTVLGILGQHENLAYLSDFYRKSFFMRGKDPSLVLVEDHDLISGLLYKRFGHTVLNTENIPQTYARHLEGKRRSDSPCATCPAKTDCHGLMEQARASTLNRIVQHLCKVKALDGHKPSRLGQLARHFPQAGGLIVASWIASGRFGAHNFRDLVQAMACFCSAHFKDIPDTYANGDLIRGLGVPRLIETYYPEDLFPEFYDDAPARGGYEPGTRVFREANPAAASLVSAWLDRNMPWDALVEAHTSKYFSAGDCMMVLFRFSTFLQSCARLQNYDPDLSALAKDALKRLLRDPLDARNRMLVDDEPETVEVSEQLPVDDELDADAQVGAAATSGAGVAVETADVATSSVPNPKRKGRPAVVATSSPAAAPAKPAPAKAPVEASVEATKNLTPAKESEDGTASGTRRKLSLFRRRETSKLP
jgi:hypothetical protein